MEIISNHGELESVSESLSQTSPRGSSRGSDYFIAPEHASHSVSDCASSGTLSVEQQIEQSKMHWSSLTESESDDDEVAEMSNVHEFEALRRHPQWGFFFQRFGKGTGRSLEVGEKFAEGGQAELYEVVHVYWYNPALNERDVEKGITYALKVFKKGTKLRHLKRQWPEGYLQFRAENWRHYEKYGKSLHKWRFWCNVVCGTLLEDGRFAFVMIRESGDLRSLIDCQMATRSRHDRGLFPKWRVENMMYKIAKGMAWLHSRNIVHRDLKASNVFLCRWHNGGYSYYIGDYECSIGVIGTGFFRAPEILQACRERNTGTKIEVFSKASDVYAYGMTCYEILTGKLPFEDHSSSNYDLIFSGQRPSLPNYIDIWICQLLDRCWQSNPNNRPTFIDILNIIEKNSNIDFSIFDEGN